MSADEHRPKRSKLRERLFTVGFMFGVTFVSISGVAAVHLATHDAVKRNEALFLRRAVMEAAGEVVPKKTDDLYRWYEASVEPHPDAVAPTAFTVRDPTSRTVRAQAFLHSGAGLWGRVTGVVGLDPDLKKVVGITFTEQNETPGLGARIEEPWFKAQFKGRTGPVRLMPEGTRSTVAQEVDGITGATITSKAVQDIVNGVLAEAPGLVGGWTGKAE